MGPYDDEKLGFYKVAQYYYYPSWWEGGEMLHLMINLGKWNELPKTCRSALFTACAYANSWMQARYDARNPLALEHLVAAGAQLRPFSPEILEACLAAANEVYAEISAQNADFKRVFEHMKAFRGDSYLWWQVAELGFDTFMVRARSRF